MGWRAEGNLAYNSILPEGKIGLVLPAGKTRKEEEGGVRWPLDWAVVCTTVFCRQFGASPQNRQIDACVRGVSPRTKLLTSHHQWQAQKCVQTVSRQGVSPHPHRANSRSFTRTPAVLLREREKHKAPGDRPVLVCGVCRVQLLP